MNVLFGINAVVFFGLAACQRGKYRWLWATGLILLMFANLFAMIYAIKQGM